MRLPAGMDTYRNIAVHSGSKQMDQYHVILRNGRETMITADSMCDDGEHMTFWNGMDVVARFAFEDCSSWWRVEPQNPSITTAKIVRT